MKSSDVISKSTKILVKNEFESTPISRSQAKRLCDELEKFVVFANAHSEIVIKLINMNEDVVKMYNHVKLSNV